MIAMKNILKVTVKRHLKSNLFRFSDDNTNLIINPSYPLPGAGVLMADKALKEVQGLAVRSQLLKSSSK